MATLLRQSSLYAMWDALRSRRRLHAYERFWDRELGSPRGIQERRPFETIQELRLRRASWPSRLPRVVGFGTNEWEQNGFWDSFHDVADFELWEYRKPYREQPRTDEAYRRALAQEFLHFLGERCAQGVDCVFFYASAAHIHSSLLTALQERGIWTVVMGLDDKQQFIKGGATEVSPQLSLAIASDVYWTTWKVGCDIIERRGGRAWYAPEAANPKYHRPLEVQRELDVLFIGQCYGRRSELIRFLKRRGFRVSAFGPGWPAGFVSFRDTLTLFSKAKIVLGVGDVNYLPGVKHLKGRDFEVPMCGAIYLTTYNPELADHYEIGREILCYESFHDCADQAHWILSHPGEAEAMRKAALERSLETHTWQGRLGDLLDYLQGTGA